MSSVPSVFNRPILLRNALTPSLPVRLWNDPPNQDLAIRLQCQSPHEAVRAGVEVGVKGAISVKSSDPIVRGGARATAQGGEKPTGYDLAVRLNRQCIDLAVRPGIETGVERSI